MTLNELSVEFDLMYNNISSNMAPGLSEFEKSVFLTQAQETIILDLYKGTGGDSFESTEEITRYLNTLIGTQTIIGESITDNPIFENKCFSCDLSELTELWFILYQSATIEGKNLLVVPTTLDRVYKEMENPFKKPNDNRLLSLSEDNKIILLSNENKTPTLYIKYLKRPYPIILQNLEDGLSINNETVAKELSVPESIHLSILLRAVQLAQTVWKA